MQIFLENKNFQKSVKNNLNSVQNKKTHSFDFFVFTTQISTPTLSERVFVGNPIYGSAVYFFVIFHTFILTPIFEIEIPDKKFLDTKIFLFLKADFGKSE